MAYHLVVVLELKFKAYFISHRLKQTRLSSIPFEFLCYLFVRKGKIYSEIISGIINLYLVYCKTFHYLILVVLQA